MSLGTLDRVRAGRGPLERCTTDPDRSSRRTGRGGGPPRRTAARRLRGPAVPRRRRPLPDHDRAPHAVLPTGEGRRDDPRGLLHAVRPRRLARCHRIANPARVAALFEDGATIVLQGLHRWSEPVARFCRDLELELGHPCQVNAYITPPGAQGLDLHVDGHDVFVLQAFGRKHWEVHAAPKEPSREPLDVELAAGDTIYLPAGTPHAARAQDVLSGHLTVGVHVTPWRDVLASALADVTAGIEDPVPAGWIDDPDGFAEELRARLAALASSLGNVDVRRAAGERRERFLSSRAQLARGTIAERSAPVDVGDDTVVARRPGAVIELSPRGAARRAPRDRRLEMPAWLEDAMRAIAEVDDDGALTVGDLAPALSDRRAVASSCGD